MHSKKAFSFVEIIVVISILALLAVVGLSLQGASNQKSQNAKAVGDIQTLNNSFESYLVEEKTLPNPKGNINYFGSGSEYVHVDAGNEDDILSSFGKHGFVTENILPKKYLNYLPLDPRTSQYYAYGKTTNSQFFEIAGVLKIEGKNTSSVIGNYPGEGGPYNLIKEYNGPNFVSNNSKTSFPYNPDEKILVAKINNYSGTVTIQGNGYLISGIQVLNHTLVEGDEITVSAGGQATLYYSDGSQSTLGDTTGETVLTLSKMEFKEDNNLVTKIQLALASGTIWTKATSLNTDSDFEIY
ncbi:type II secretion system GspH family protein, partial [Candidatus Gracilibacteria bacterium]|nr:type II secretion system GspH family protein [Candidatus Gracilibacteria bacterium]